MELHNLSGMLLDSRKVTVSQAGESLSQVRLQTEYTPLPVVLSVLIGFVYDDRTL